MQSLNRDIVDRILAMADKLTQSRAALVSTSFNKSATRSLYRVVDFSSTRPDFSPTGLIDTLLTHPELARFVNVVKIRVPNFRLTTEQFHLLFQNIPNITSFEVISTSHWPGDMGDWFIPAISEHTMISRLALDYDTEEEENVLLTLLDSFPTTLRHLELRRKHGSSSPAWGGTSAGGWGTAVSPWGAGDGGWGAGAGWGQTQQAPSEPTNSALSLTERNEDPLPLSFQDLRSLRARWTVAARIISKYRCRLFRLDVEFDRGGESWPQVSLPNLQFLRVRHGWCVNQAAERAMFDGIVKSAPNLQVLIVRIENKGNWPHIDKLHRLRVFAIENHYDDCYQEPTENALDYVWEYCHQVFPMPPQMHRPPISVLFKHKLATYRNGIGTPRYILVENGEISWNDFDV